MPRYSCRRLQVDSPAAIILAILFAFATACTPRPNQENATPAMNANNEQEAAIIQVLSTGDFDLTGDGSNPVWNKAGYVALQPREGGTLNYTTRIKLLYSETGLYIFLDAQDQRLTATLEGDYLHLWTEDVFEAFLWTDEAYPIYFEYEISSLGYELPLIIPNFGGDYFGWIPWQYEGERKIRKAVATIGGPHASGAAITAWRAEVFIPYILLNPLRNVPPVPGTKWRANFYRNDYDDGENPTRWEWVPTGGTYHAYEKFGTLAFE